VKSQPCYLKFTTDMPSEASFCESLSAAKEQYLKVAYRLASWGQQITASVHFVEAQGDDFAEEPDRLLSLTRSGNVKVEVN